MFIRFGIHKKEERMNFDDEQQLLIAEMLVRELKPSSTKTKVNGLTLEERHIIFTNDVVKLRSGHQEYLDTLKARYNALAPDN